MRPVPRSSAPPGRRDIHPRTTLQGSYPVPPCTRKYLDEKGTCRSAFACTRAPRGTAFTLPPPYHVHAPSSPRGNQTALSLQGSHHRVAHRVAHRVTPTTTRPSVPRAKVRRAFPGRDDARLASATRRGLGETPARDPTAGGCGDANPQKPLQGSYPVPGQHLVQILIKSARACYPVPVSHPTTSSYHQVPRPLPCTYPVAVAPRWNGTEPPSHSVATL